MQKLKRNCNCQTLLAILISARALYFTYLSLQVYVIMILCLFLIQFSREGFTPLIVVNTILVTIQIFSSGYYEQVALTIIAVIRLALLFLLPLRIYWLLSQPAGIGFKNYNLSSGLAYHEFFPIDDSQPITYRMIKWNQGNEIQRIIQSFAKKMASKLQVFFSYINKQTIKVGDGTPEKVRKSLAFCPGRTCTTFFYTNFITHMAGLSFRVGSVNFKPEYDQNISPFSLKQQIKRYREKEVIQRAAAFTQAIQQVETQAITLMGHSYGCSTLIQAYHSLSPSLKDKVTHLILLDPTFFALTQAILHKPINCKMLMLSTEHYVSLQDMHVRNKEFLKIHSQVEYINWKGASHMQLSDLGFIMGNLFGGVKYYDRSKEVLDLSLDAIDNFLKGNRVEGIYGDKELGRDFIPIFRPQSQYIF